MIVWFQGWVKVWFGGDKYFPFLQIAELLLFLGLTRFNVKQAKYIFLGSTILPNHVQRARPGIFDVIFAIRKKV